MVRLSRVLSYLQNNRRRGSALLPLRQCYIAAPRRNACTCRASPTAVGKWVCPYFVNCSICALNSGSSKYSFQSSSCTTCNATSVSRCERGCVATVAMPIRVRWWRTSGQGYRTSNALSSLLEKLVSFFPCFAQQARASNKLNPPQRGTGIG